MTKLARIFGVVVALFVSLTVLGPAWAADDAPASAVDSEAAGQDAPLIEALTDTTVEPLTIQFNNNYHLDLSWGWDHFTEDPIYYDHDLAQAGILLTEAAKTSQEATEARLDVLGFDHVESQYYDNFIAVDNPATTFGSQLVMLDGEPTVVVTAVIRGTNSFGDVLTDIGAVFNRFAPAAANVNDRLEHYIEGLDEVYGFDVNPDNTVLFITGHSLGGAVAGQLAVLAEEELANPDSIFAYSFAAPKYATDSADERANIHTIINTEDLWPALPLSGGHNGNQYYYDSTEDRYQAYLDELYATEGWEAKSIPDRHDPPTYLAMMLAEQPATES